ncbi:hypothetical protein UY3_13116 [Chelonia mydas]|uniref:Uncharacterized protein n=1 Tax=Chelonia mydas TaxID=8469 RepID=M7BNI3_CHEMY|nr:hypothetical protein UY3_13116 [Chelonia mydas]
MLLPASEPGTNLYQPLPLEEYPEELPLSKYPKEQLELSVAKYPKELEGLWKCGLEGLSIHTNRGAQPYKKEKKEDVGQHVPRDPVSLWVVVSENGNGKCTEDKRTRQGKRYTAGDDSAKNGNGKCTEDKHTRQGKRYTAGDDSASPAPNGHAGDSYRTSGPSHPCSPPSAAY